MLSELLRQHPRIYWDGETYGRVFGRLKELETPRAFSGFDPVAYVTGRIDRSGRRWFGFDLKFFQVTEFGVELETYVAEIAAAGIEHVAVLRRRNYLRKVVSSLNAGRRGSSHYRNGTAVPSLPPLEIDPTSVWVDVDRSSLLEHFERWDGWYGTVESHGGSIELLTLDYETDIEIDPRVGYRRVIGRLGEDHYTADVTLRRSNPEPLDSLVANLDEVAAHLAGSRCERMVDSRWVPDGRGSDEREEGLELTRCRDHLQVGRMRPKQ